MKYLKHITISLVSLLVMGACAQPEPLYLHDDNTIHSIIITPGPDENGNSISASVVGEINNETGEIIFTVPRADRQKFDATAVKVRATVNYDVQITPSLSGIKDLSDWYDISVTATMTGQSKGYKLIVDYER